LILLPTSRLRCSLLGRSLQFILLYFKEKSDKKGKQQLLGKQGR